jgi:hypothetical protein
MDSYEYEFQRMIAGDLKSHTAAATEVVIS